MGVLTLVGAAAAVVVFVAGNRAAGRLTKDDRPYPGAGQAADPRADEEAARHGTR